VSDLEPLSDGIRGEPGSDLSLHRPTGVQVGSSNVQVNNFYGDPTAANTNVAPLKSASGAASSEAFKVERERYLGRVRERYQRVDLEVLTPLTEQGQHPHMLLGTIFIPQLVRADPPPLELPREFWLRLATAGEVREDDLPEGLDRTSIERVRRAYQERPAQPVLDVVSRPGNRKVVLLGDPGAGKSTLARYLMLAAAGHLGSGGTPNHGQQALTGLLPLLVELRTFASPLWREGTFLDLIHHLHMTENLGMPRPALESFLEGGGRALVVFDGLDEIFDPALREEVTKRIEAFAALYPQTRVIVTSRVFGYRRTVLDAAGFTHWMLQDLDHAQIDAFTSTWYKASCQGNPAEETRLRDRLMAAIRDSAAVAELAGNPMLLTILAIIGRRQELPRERRAVYDHAVSVLIEHWDATGKHLHDARVDDGMDYLSREDKLELLRLVARRMQNGPASLAGNHLPGPELCAEFENFLGRRFQLPASRAAPAARSMVDQLRERNFILARFGAGVYGFVHRAFLEYLAADDISARFAAHEISPEDLVQVFAARWNDPAWHEVLVLVAGMIPAPFAAAAIDVLLTADPGAQVAPAKIPAHLHLAIKCFGEVRKPGEIAAKGQAISREIIKLLETYDANKRTYYLVPNVTSLVSAAVPVLAKLGPHWTGRHTYEDWYLSRGQYLLPARFDAELAYAAARIYFSQLGSGGKATDILRSSAVQSSHPYVRRAAVESLATAYDADGSSVLLLRDRAINDWDEAVRKAAVEALVTRWHDDPATAAFLRDRATKDWHENVRQAALGALANGWHDDPATAAFLRQCAINDRHWQVRQAAVETLAAGWHEDPPTIQLLQDVIAADRSGDVRQAAVEALATRWYDDPATTMLLSDRVTNDRHWQVRQAAVGALATRWHDDPATTVLLHDRATNDPDEDVRNAAVEALANGWHDDHATVPLLHDRATKDWHEKVRQAAVEALANGWHDDPATTVLLHDRATKDWHENVRQTAMNALAAAWHTDPNTMPLLHDRVANDWDESVRGAAIDALANGWHDDPAMASLFQDWATDNPHEDVRASALNALATRWHDDPATVTLLHDRAANDRHEDVRVAALIALATRWHDDSSTATILHDRAANDDHWVVRQTAANALAAGWHDDSSTVQLMHDHASNDSDEWVRRSALENLAARWHDDPATEPLLLHRARTDGHKDVREAMVDALVAGWHDNPSTLALLTEMIIGDRDESVRKEALSALGIFWHGDPAIAEIIHHCGTADHDPEFRQRVLDIVASLWQNDPETVAWLHDRAIKDWHESVRQSSLEMIAARWHDDEATTKLLHDRANNDWNVSVRIAALKALADGWHADPDTLRLLRDKAISDNEWNVRQTAMRALAEGWQDERELTALWKEASVYQHSVPDQPDLPVQEEKES
jgi:HEAT repeats/NACHT domain